jgi:hypothetical protein
MFSPANSASAVVARATILGEGCPSSTQLPSEHRGISRGVAALLIEIEDVALGTKDTQNSLDPRSSRSARMRIADEVAAIRIDIAAGSVYLRSCPSGTQSTSGPPPDFSEIEITPGLKRMPGASLAIRSGGQPCSPRARRSRPGPA